MTKERVVVTGIGTVSSVGTGREAFWNGIVEGRSGVKRVTTARVKEEMQIFRTKTSSTHGSLHSVRRRSRSTGC